MTIRLMTGKEWAYYWKTMGKATAPVAKAAAKTTVAAGAGVAEAAKSAAKTVAGAASGPSYAKLALYGVGAAVVVYFIAKK